MKEKTPAAIDIIHVLMKSANYVQREFQSQLSLLEAPYALTGPRLRVLSTVANNPSIRMNELAKKLDIKARTVTDFVDALEKEGLLQRLADPNDRRVTRLQVTALANASLDEALAYQTDVAEHMLRHLTTTEREQLLNMLLRLRKEGK